ncbi:MAG TPA: DUF721 domain-containing protein [Bacteroidetes bacterium]|nr:DUF721 domain-containing protein [Bacteroidota bacterium]
MRRSHTQSLGEIIREILKDSVTGRKLREVQLIGAWEEVVGKTVAKRTKNLYIRNRKLYVELTSSVVRNELMMIRSSLVGALNKKAGEDLIEEIVLR